MTTINTIEDFLRIVREDEELRLAVRRELLTEELLTLPQRVSTLTDNVNALARSIDEYKTATDQRLTRIEEHANTTDQRLTGIEGRLTGIEGRLTGIEGRVTGIEGRLDRQHGMLRRQHDDLARFRGNYAIDAARGKSVAIARLFAHRYNLRRILARVLSVNDRAEILNMNTSALDTLNLDSDAWDSFIERSDLIAEVTDLHSRDEPRYYIAAEASFTAHDRDIERATDHARIIRCATGLDAYAVIAAVRLDPQIDSDLILEDAEEYMNANSEDTALWFPLVEDDLEPLDPC